MIIWATSVVLQTPDCLELILRAHPCGSSAPCTLPAGYSSPALHRPCSRPLLHPRSPLLFLAPCLEAAQGCPKCGTAGWGCPAPEKQLSTTTARACSITQGRGAPAQCHSPPLSKCVCLQLNLAEHRAVLTKTPGGSDGQALPWQILLLLCCSTSSKH